MGVCCRIQLCCPPEKAAAALAEKYGIPQDAALSLVTDFQLVPREIETLDGATHPQAGQEMLARLLRHASAELRAILTALGHPTTEAAG